MVLTTLLSVASAVLAVGLLVASGAPFDRAFSQQRGAHLTVRFAGSADSTGAWPAATARAPESPRPPARSPSSPYVSVRTERRLLPGSNRRP